MEELIKDIGCSAAYIAAGGSVVQLVMLLLERLTGF